VTVELKRRLRSTRTASEIDRDLAWLMMSIVGRHYSRWLCPPGVESGLRESLTGLLAMGRSRAAKIDPFLRPGDEILDYGAGIGRVARFIAPRCRRLTCVDIDPLTLIYGPALCPDATFALRQSVPPVEDFDFSYSVAVFFHLDDEAQREALEYVHARLRPGGRFLLDVVLGPERREPRGRPGNVGVAQRETFVGLCRDVFQQVEAVELFGVNDAFLLRKGRT
jgi:SAM-dependent methyltransferase